MRTIAIMNQKGGCGKTTTAINLAGVFSRMGQRTLLVDLDPQSHCAAGLAIPEGRIDVQIGDAMMARPEQSIDWTRLLWRVSRHMDLAPSTTRLAALESARGGLAGADDAHKRLSGVLGRLSDQYDFCLIDCPPSIGMLTYNALAAATEILIPVETGFFALQGAAKQVEAIRSMSKRLEAQASQIPAWRILPTMHNPDASLARDVLDELSRRFGDHLIPVVIRYDHRLREAVSFGQPIVEYAAESDGAADYGQLGQYLLTDAGRLPVTKPLTQRLTPVVDILDAGVETLGRQTAGASARSSVGGTATALEAPPLLASAVTEAKPAAAAASLSAEEIRGRLLELTSRVSKLADRARQEVRGLSVADLTPRQPKPEGDDRQVVFGARVTSAGVLFVQPAGLGKSVCIAGDFNGWSAEAAPMHRNERLGVFERVLPLPAGKWQYRLVVDGRWIADPHNPSTSPNPFGGENSLLNVGVSPSRL